MLHHRSLSTPRAWVARTTLAMLTFVALAACGGGDKETATGDTAAGATASADTGMAGMDHSNMAMNQTPAKDADQEFMRMMTNHHEGLILMMDPAMEKASSSTAKADAKKLHDKQHQERDSMLAMLRTGYNDEHKATPAASAKQMNDDLQKRSGADYDRTMYAHVVMHHQEALKMIDDFLPRLQNPQLKAMAQKMRTDQAREIADFERKQGTTG